MLSAALWSACPTKQQRPQSNTACVRRFRLSPSRIHSTSATCRRGRLRRTPPRPVWPCRPETSRVGRTPTSAPRPVGACEAVPASRIPVSCSTATPHPVRFSLGHDALGDLVVEIGAKRDSLRRRFFKQPPRRASFLGLQPFPYRAGVSGTIQFRPSRRYHRSCRDVDDPHVDANKSVNRIGQRGFSCLIVAYRSHLPSRHTQVGLPDRTGAQQNQHLVQRRAPGRCVQSTMCRTRLTLPLPAHLHVSGICQDRHRASNGCAASARNFIGFGGHPVSLAWNQADHSYRQRC